jgi:Fur family transcriptional regulator, ferric uptake regulator
MTDHTFETEIIHLRQQGYRITPQRLVILRILNHADCHMAPAEIYQQATLEMPGLTEATVYRTLNFLAEKGLALVAHVGNGQLVYEIASRAHHHLICRNCGDTLEIEHELLSLLYQAFMDRTGYQIDTLHAIFFGLCPDCQSNLSFERKE